MKHTIPIRLCMVLSALLFGFTSCHQFFQGKIDMTQKDRSATLTDLLSDAKPIAQLDKPAQIFVSHGKNADAVKIHITWSAVTGAASYRLERAVVQANDDGTFTRPDESEFEIIKATGTNPITSSYITGTSYTDVILNSENAKYSDKEYTYGFFYRVSAENAYKKYDPSVFTESAEAGTLLAPPRSPRASLGDSEQYIMFTWEKNDGASYYRIYRSENRDGTNGLYLGRVAANQNQYKDAIPSSQQGKEYYYTVYAQNAAGNTSVASAPALGFTLIAGAPPKIQNVRVTDGRGSTVDHVAITWDSPSGTDITYAVYRTSSTDSAYLLCSNTVTQTSYTDTQSLRPNVYYYYQVQAIKTVVNSDGTTTVTKGPFSASSPTDAHPAEAYLLSPPASFEVSKLRGSSPAKVLFKFPAALGSPECPTNSNIYHDYNTYTYRLCGGPTPDTVGTEIPVSMPTAINGYYEVEADPGNHKFFTVATVNGIRQSAPSTVAAPAPYEAKDVTATQHKAIAGFTDAGSANSSGVYPVQITWHTPDEGADGGYYIYRSTQKTNGFRRITETPVTELSYIDKNDTAKTGTYYYYKVLSLNSLLQGINFTDAVRGYGALTRDQYFREYNKTIKRSHQKLTLMHKPGTSALGSETAQGDIGGNVRYEAKMSGLGARITMYYNDYCDYYVSGSVQLGIYFTLTGNTNTSANISSNGSMDGTVTCTGMYPGTIVYDKIEIKGGNAGGGYYVVTPEGFPAGNVSYAIGLE